jgi:hypothetical protein
MGRVKSAVKELPGMVVTGVIDSAVGAAGWIGAQYGASLLPFTDSSSAEYFGLQPIETAKRVGVTVALGVIAKVLGVSKERVRILVAGGLLNTTLSIIESVLPTNLAGSLGLYPGNPMLAGPPNNFVAPGFFPSLPGTVEGDGHGDGLGAYVQYMH